MGTTIHHKQSQTLPRRFNQVERFHNRPISDKYVAIYCDATYLNVRRDSVAKEALHVILGITVEGTKEVLDYALYP